MGLAGLSPSLTSVAMKSQTGFYHLPIARLECAPQNELGIVVPLSWLVIMLWSLCVSLMCGEQSLRVELGTGGSHNSRTDGWGGERQTASVQGQEKVAMKALP